jgi:hypothetical protein
MYRTPQNTKFSGIVIIVLAFTIALPLFLAPDTALARRGGDDGDRSRFYGIIESMPSGLHGDWVIGGRRATTAPGTQFEGPLAIGGCAKVDVRSGRVHEIESEPLHDCR